MQSNTNFKDVQVHRILGKHQGAEGGNMLLITAGVHGNEPSGVMAIRKVLEKLELGKVKLNGTVLALAGNVTALNENQRFIDRDLNRVWPDQKLQSRGNQSSEEQEMIDIINELENYPASRFKQRYFIDLHSTSAPSLPYISVQNVGDNDKWACDFPLYIVRGFSDLIEGSIDHYFSHQGMTGFAYEGGQHDEPSTVDHQEAIIWLALQKAGLLSFHDLGGKPKTVSDIEEKEEQKVFEIEHRHSLAKGDRFEMKPGYKNFQKIVKGEELAVHNGKVIKSEWDGYIFMPLYQKQGNDGFFVVNNIS